MAYDIKGEDLDNYFLWANEKIQTYFAALGRISEASIRVQTLEGFEGEGANSAKAYFGEAHLICIEALQVILQEALTRYMLYMDSYFSEIDTSQSFMLNQDSLTDTYTHFAHMKSTLIERRDGLSHTVSNISDIVSVDNPPTHSLYYAISDLSFDSSILRDRIEENEAFHVASFGRLDDLIAPARDLINSLGTTSSPTSYIEGSAYASETFYDLFTAIGISLEYLDSNDGRLENIYSALDQRMYDRAVEEEARLREQEGWIVTRHIPLFGFRGFTSN